jgi:hypothetical protein
MSKWFLIILICCGYSSYVLALPDKIEVWFLYPGQKKTSNTYKYPSNLVAANDQECIKMGEGCFNPQFGYIEKKKPVKSGVSPSKETKVAKDNTPMIYDTEKEKNALPAFGATDRSVINCDKKNAFDLFCGESRKFEEEKKAFELEVWIDISASMREVDPLDKGGEYCYRRSFAERIEKMCGKEKTEFSVFSTSIKMMDTKSTLCTNYGLNDPKAVLQWIDRSTAKKLIIITDVNEAQLEFISQLSARGAQFKGHLALGFYAEDMLAELDKLKMMACK